MRVSVLSTVGSWLGLIGTPFSSSSDVAAASSTILSPGSCGSVSGATAFAAFASMAAVRTVSTALVTACTTASGTPIILPAAASIIFTREAPSAPCEAAFSTASNIWLPVVCTPTCVPWLTVPIVPPIGTLPIGDSPKTTVAWPLVGSIPIVSGVAHSGIWKPPTTAS